MKIITQKPYWITLPAILSVSILFFFGNSPEGALDKTGPAADQAMETSSTQEDQAELSEEDTVALPFFRDWTNFTTEDGLPSDKISTIRIDRDRVWIGTDKGLAIYENGEFTVLTTEDGLSHDYVMSIDISELTGEVWIATMSGLTRWSAGEMTIYNQFNSGLANDVVYSVVTDRQYVWTATAAGASSFDTYTGQWEIFNEQNAPMHEPWTYGVANGDDKIYIAAWGGGVLEYFKDSGQFRVHADPDHQMQIDLYPDDGVAHDITTGVSHANDVLWVGTYFGLSRYDGRRWNSYYEHDSGLPSDFINFLKAQDDVVYLSTDNGFGMFDGQRWAAYTNENGRGKVTLTNGEKVEELFLETAISNNYVWGLDVQGDEVWLATADGVSYSKASNVPELQSSNLQETASDERNSK